MLSNERLVLNWVAWSFTTLTRQLRSIVLTELRLLTIDLLRFPCNPFFWTYLVSVHCADASRHCLSGLPKECPRLYRSRISSLGSCRKSRSRDGEASFLSAHARSQPPPKRLMEAKRACCEGRGAWKGRDAKIQKGAWKPAAAEYISIEDGDIYRGMKK
jgi:hypothetical protein